MYTENKYRELSHMTICDLSWSLTPSTKAVEFTNANGYKFTSKTVKALLPSDRFVYL